MSAAPDTATTTNDDTAAPADTSSPDNGSVEDTEPVLDGIVVSEVAPPVETSTVCVSDPTATELHVDYASTAATPTGSSACPFKRVSDAVAYANMVGTTTTRMIRVRAGIYNETAAIILRKGLTLSGYGAGVTKLTGGGPCTSSTTGYKCVVRVDGGGTLERVTVDAAPGDKHGVVTGAADGIFPVVRNTAISGASGSCCAGILVTGGAILGPNIESTLNGYGLVIWGSQPVKILAGANKFDENTVGINHEGIGALTFEGGSVSRNRDGMRLGEPVATTPPTHDIRFLVAKDNIEYGVKVMGVASAKIRNSTFTGNKFGVIGMYGASNYIDLGNAGNAGSNNFGSATVKNSRGAICTLFTKPTPFDATGNTFPECLPPRNIGDVSPDGGCEAVTTYADVWYRGATVPITASCTKGL